MRFVVKELIQAYELPFRRRLEGRGGVTQLMDSSGVTLNYVSPLSAYDPLAGAATASTVNHRFISSCSFNFSFFFFSHLDSLCFGVIGVFAPSV